MRIISREEAAWMRGERERKKAAGPEKRKKLRVEVWHGKQEMQVACSRYPERNSEVI
jgi:hypothetical protein